jgi:glycosyltransferase involved in cell wall biosynthesis
LFLTLNRNAILKVGIVCFNHFDATISLGKYLTLLFPEIVVEYIFILSQSSLNIEILNLKAYELKNGFIDDNQINSIVDKEIFNYISPNRLIFFLFNSIKIADVKNYKLLMDLRKNIVGNKYDLLHFVGNNPWIVFLNYLVKNIPKIHTIHEPYPFVHMTKYRLQRFKRTVNLILRSSTHVIVPSQVSYNRLQNHYKISNIRISIIPFGPFEIYKEYSDNRIIKEDNLLLYYGYIDEYKGIDILIESMMKISKENKKLKLIIAGGNGHIDQNSFQSNPNIEVFNRHLSNKEIAEFNQLATLVICPYTAASQSGVVMTSFAFGNPIIATNVGAMPEMIEDKVTGIIIEPGNSDLLCKAILDLFQNPQKINELRCNVRSKYLNSENSWLNIAEQTYRLYQKQIKSNRDPT